MNMKFFKKKTEQPAVSDNVNLNKTRKKKKIKKLIKVLAVILVLAVIGGIVYNKLVVSKLKQAISDDTAETAEVTKMDIQKVLSSSGTIAPLNTYNLTTLVEGEVISADFEEGDQVEEGDVLYQVTTDDLDSQINSAKTSLSRAEKNHENAQEKYDKAVDKYNEAIADYNEASEKYSDLTIKSTASGYVKSLSVEEGDDIQSGDTIASIYDNTYMLLEVPFISADAKSSLVGETAEVQISDSDETLKGTVTKVSSIEEALSGNQVVKTVTVKVKNPGGITTTTTATASIGDLDSSSEGTFSVFEDTTLTADKSGEIVSLNIQEGDRIKDGETVIVLASDTYDDELDTYQAAVDSAKDSVDSAEDTVTSAKEGIEDAEDAMDDIVDEKADYSITAPITGEIISKDVLVGDTISKDNSATLCTIYDLSALTFEMAIDELDIMEVEEGQTVNITADALDEVTFTGTVTNISLESTTSQGVTQYPVTVQIDETGDLLPGMNVTGEIVVDEVKDVLSVPNDALMRGDKVYVQDSSVTETDGDVPAGFKAVEVETGLSNDDYIEITSGLSEGDVVYVERSTTSGENVMMPGGMQGAPSGDMQGGGNGGGAPSGGMQGGGGR